MCQSLLCLKYRTSLSKSRLTSTRTCTDKCATAMLLTILSSFDMDNRHEEFRPTRCQSRLVWMQNEVDRKGHEAAVLGQTVAI